jgi:putative ABC transport system permease protein
MSGRTTLGGLFLRHLARGRGAATVVALLVAVLAAVATFVPVAVAALDRDTLRDQLAQIGPNVRDVGATPGGTPLGAVAWDGSSPTTDQVWAPFLDGLEAVRASAEPPLSALLAPAQVVTRSLDNGIREDDTRGLSVAFDPRYQDRVALVDGAWPAAPVLGSMSEGGESSPGVLEVVLSAGTAEAMGWAVGETRSIGRRLVVTDPVPWRLSGTFEAVDPDDGYWQHVRSVLDPNIVDDGNRPPIVTGTGFAHPAAVEVANLLAGRVETAIWFPVDTASITGPDAENAATALRRFTSESQPIIEAPGTGAGITSVRFDAPVLDTIDTALAQSRATAAILAMIAAGPAGVAVLVLLLCCRLILERRRTTLRLLSARGGSTAQLRALLGIEGLALGIVPAAVGTGAVLAATGTAPEPVMLVVPILVACAPAAVLAVMAGSAADRTARADLGRSVPRRRVLGEALALALAAVAVALLVLRGYSSARFDPLLAATPLLVAIAGALVTLRLYPLPLRALLERARRGGRMTSFLGAARALREPALGLIPVVALVVGVSVAVSSAVLLSTLQTGIRTSAEGRIGADVRIDGARFDAAALESIRAVDGVAAATGLSGAEPVRLDIGGSERQTSVHLVDARELADVQGSRLGILPPGASLEPGSGPVPIVVSAGIADLIGGAAVAVEGVEAEVVGVATGQTPLSSRANWIAVDSSYADTLLGGEAADRLVLARLDAGASAADVEAELRATLGPLVRVDAPGDILRDIEAGPAVQGLRLALAVATGFAAALAALAVVLTLTLIAGARERLLALLSALGAGRDARRRLIAWEIGPPAMAAVVVGSLFGAILPLLVLAAVDLRPFTGSALAPAYAVDPGIVALTLGGFVGGAAALSAVALLVSRPARNGRAARTVGEA